MTTPEHPQPTSSASVTPAPTAEQTTQLTPAAVRAATVVLPADTPFLMVNLLRYHPQAEYRDRPDVTPCTGREAYYQRYVPAFGQVAAELGLKDVKPFWVGNVQAQLVAPAGEHWDDVAIVHYPSFAAFRQLTESPTYLAEADPHRQAALADWRLIATFQQDLPS